MTLTEQEFRVKSDDALRAGAARAAAAGRSRKGFEVELQTARSTCSSRSRPKRGSSCQPNAPVRQIWVSAMARGYKLSWEPAAGAFALERRDAPAAAGSPHPANFSSKAE